MVHDFAIHLEFFKEERGKEEERETEGGGEGDGRGARGGRERGEEGRGGEARRRAKRKGIQLVRAGLKSGPFQVRDLRA